MAATLFAAIDVGSYELELTIYEISPKKGIVQLDRMRKVIGLGHVSYTHLEGLVGTPDRIARMCEEIYGGTDEEVAVHLSKTFPASGNEIVLEKDIALYSMCEHHLLPFFGHAHVAYVPEMCIRDRRQAL